MALERKPYWDTRELNDFLIARAFAPFSWGVNDCALFVADAIEAMTGTDIAADFRGYTDEAGAWDAIRRVRGAVLGSVLGSGADAEVTVDAAAEYCAQKFALEEAAFPLEARRGDFCTFMHAGRLMLGLIHLNGRDIVTPGDKGLERAAMAEIAIGEDGAEVVTMAIRRAWHV
jgi:hypothetical protein